jgi:hypothetical protein
MTANILKYFLLPPKKRLKNIPFLVIIEKHLQCPKELERWGKFLLQKRLN